MNNKERNILTIIIAAVAVVALVIFAYSIDPNRAKSESTGSYATRQFSTESGDSITLSYTGDKNIYTLDSGLLVTNGEDVAATITYMSAERFDSSLENMGYDAANLTLIDEGTKNNLVYAVVASDDSIYGIAWINESSTGLWFTGYSDAQSLVAIINDTTAVINSTTSQARSIESTGLAEAFASAATAVSEEETIISGEDVMTEGNTAQEQVEEVIVDDASAEVSEDIVEDTTEAPAEQ